MAQAGTPTVKANQPAASNFNGLWQALLALIAILALGAGVVVLSNMAAANRGSAVPTVDHRLDRIEAQKGATSFAGPKADRRFDELMLPAAGAVPGPADYGYGQTGGSVIPAGEGFGPGGRTAPSAGQSTIDSSYDQVEQNRGIVLTPAIKGTSDSGNSLSVGSLSAPTIHYPDVSYDQVQLKPFTQTTISGTAPDYGPGRVVGHRGAQIDQ